MGDGFTASTAAGARAWVASALQVEVEGLELLEGGAGARRYWRVRLAGGHSAVLMHALPEHPEILPPALRVQGAALPFVEVTELLAAEGLPVPELLAHDARQRWVLLEDLGSTHLRDLPDARRLERTGEAIDWLARAHAIRPRDALPFRRAFDAEWIDFELSTFRAHGAPGGATPELGAALDALVSWIAALPRALSLRDYQSHNLMIDAQERLRIIDYQDALLAPRELDLAALLWDSYVAITPEQRAALLERYTRHSGVAIDAEALAALVVQRKCKDLGRFRRLAAAGDARYAAFVEPARSAVRGALPALPSALSGAAPELARALEDAA